MADKWQREFWLQVGLSSESWLSRHDGWSLQKVSTPGQDTQLPSLTCLPSHGVVESLNHVPLFCSPMDCSLPGYSVHGTSQARILEWVAISFFRESSRPRDGTCVSCIGRQVLYDWATWEPPGTESSFKISTHRRPSFWIHCHLWRDRLKDSF